MMGENSSYMFSHRPFECVSYMHELVNLLWAIAILN
jgi:hypothetical protein